MSETATGTLSQKSVLKDMLAQCAGWQAMVDAADATAAAAFVFVEGFRVTNLARPFAEISGGSNVTDELTGHVSGVLQMSIEAEVPEEYQDDVEFADPMIWFENQISIVRDELIDLSRGTGGWLIIRTIEMDFPKRGDEDQRESEGDFLVAELTINFGI